MEEPWAMTHTKHKVDFSQMWTVALREASSSPLGRWGRRASARQTLREENEWTPTNCELSGRPIGEIQVRQYQDGVEKIARQKRSWSFDKNRRRIVLCVWKSKA
jgi:hypothetical protein